MPGAREVFARSLAARPALVEPALGQADGRIFRPAEGLARAAKPRQAMRLV